MTSRSFRRLFPQLNVQSIPEDEFYRQASLSQLLTGPDEQELASFRPDIKDPLELVEATPELAGMLGSSLEFVDSRWDSLKALRPPTPPPPPPRPSVRLSPRPPQRIPPFFPAQRQGATQPAAQGENVLQHSLGCSAPAAKTETKLAAMWEPQQPGSKSAADPPTAKPNMTMSASMWELQRLRAKSAGITNCPHLDSMMDSNMWEQQRQRSKDPGGADSATSANSNSKTDSIMWKQQRQGSKTTGVAAVQSDMAIGASMWEPQRLRSRNTVTPDAKVDDVLSEPQLLGSKNSGNANPADSDDVVDANTWKRQDQGSNTGAVLDPTNPGSSVDGRIWEPQRLRSKNAAITSPAKPDTNTWERHGIKRVGGNSTAPRREANSCDTQGGKTTKMDAAWQRNLGNVRVHIRDLGMKVGESVVRRDVKKAQAKVVGKGARVKTRS